MARCSYGDDDDYVPDDVCLEESEQKTLKTMESGYHANFCIPLEDERTCCICQGAYRQPMQLACGHRFCKACLDDHRNSQEQRRSQFSCPIDRTIVELDQVFPDRAIERHILSLAVKCDNMEHCNWTGELRGLEDHMQVCPFKGLTCDYCNVIYFVKDKQNHETGCDYWPLNCVNSCGAEGVPRKEMSLHLQTCPMVIFPCSYQYLGCTFTGTTTQMKVHLVSDVDNHLSIAILKLTSQNEDLQKKLEASVEHCSDLERRFERFVRRTYPSPVIGKALNEAIKSDNTFIIFPVKNYDKRLRPDASNKRERSDLFYSHHGGYKLNLCAQFNELDITLYFEASKSRYDNTLEWPYPVQYTISLLHPLDETKHIIKSCVPQIQQEMFLSSLFMRDSKERYLVGTFKHSYIKDKGFLFNDTLYLMCKLDL